ncbi:MAG TPA: glutamate--tRNA ligase [Chitinivibrionales bacterium]|nr:glutamate--tRNA ligase [Chitinivibrionales bacterium]
MSFPVRVRFAPSPTGYLHVGGARTALFNYLFAKHTNGTFILRIEDTDRNRFVEGALREIYGSLKWLGLTWDEGPEAGGNFGPYVQSERLDLYKKNAQALLDKSLAYPCFCTPQRLEEVRKEREKAKMLTSYDRHCRDLSKEEIQKNLDENKPFVVRLKIPHDRNIVFTDMIRGSIEYKSEVLDDFVLLKSDGYPTYHLANVVDDHEMEISHVLRGDDWIASTPRHILLYEALGWTPPLFAHMPVILDPSGGKLSKRKGAASVMDYKNAGILPDALFNFLALLGWAPGGGDEREKMTREEIIQAFSLEKISPKGAVLDEKKLDWMNGQYLAESSAESLAPEAFRLWKEKGMVPADKPATDPYLLSVINLLKVRSKRLTELVDNSTYFFKDPETYEEKAAKKYFTPQSAAVLTSLVDKLVPAEPFSKDALDALYHKFAADSGTQIGELVHPSRLAISGASFGPGLFEMMETLGKDVVLRRMKRAIEKIK